MKCSRCSKSIALKSSGNPGCTTKEIAHDPRSPTRLTAYRHPGSDSDAEVAGPVQAGIAVFTGTLASTCLAVLFVPSFFVIVRRFEEWRLARKGKAMQPAPAE
jgi:hypothetical protein